MCEDLNRHQDCARKKQVPLHFGRDDPSAVGHGSKNVQERTAEDSEKHHGKHCPPIH